jgi:Ca2+/Na+ antiporter
MDLLLVKGMLLGGIMFGSVVASLFFLRFWKMTHDRLFLYFSLAFLTLAFSRMLMAFSEVFSDEHPAVYVVRLIAYGLIIFGILDKNIKKSRSSEAQSITRASLQKVTQNPKSRPTET